jgi:hypothetical protein
VPAEGARAERLAVAEFVQGAVELSAGARAQVVAAILAAGLLLVEADFVAARVERGRLAASGAGDSPIGLRPAVAIDRRPFPPAAIWDRIGQTSEAIGRPLCRPQAAATGRAVGIDRAAVIDPAVETGPG